MFIAIVLGVLQGLTEFIPVSSSGHLVLAHELFGLNEIGLAFDVALHLGTLVAVVYYFRKDIKQLLHGVLRKKPSQVKLAKVLLVGTVPAVLIGLAMQGVIATVLRTPEVVIAMLFIFGAVMLLAERQSEVFKKHKSAQKISTKDALLIGCLQACALVPGVSRSGATISGGLLLGIDRVSATRFSFLLAVPIILGASVKVLLFDGASSAISSEFGVFAAGFITALASGLFAIRFLLKFVANYSLKTFAYYRFAVAGLLVVLLLAR